MTRLFKFELLFNDMIFIALLFVSYSTIAWVASARQGVQPEVSYAPRASTSTGRVFQFFSALGDVAFAFAGHNVVLEIQATIPSTPEKPSKKPMWKGVLIAYIVVAMCYFPVAFCGYAVFGKNVEDNILVSLEKPAWLIAAANLFVVVHVIGSYQVSFEFIFTTDGPLLLLLMTVLCYCMNSGFCYACLRHGGIVLGEEDEFQANSTTSYFYSYLLRW